MARLDRPPPCLLRAFDEERYAVDFVERGRLRLGKLSRYRRIDSDSRKDCAEGQAVYVDRGNNEQQFKMDGPIYLFCCSTPAVDLDYLCSKMGRFIVRIGSPFSFARDIEAYLQGQGVCTLNGVNGRAVEYSEDLAVDAHLDPMQRAVLNVTKKPSEYRSECEYRLFAILNQDASLAAEDVLPVDLGVRLRYAEILHR